jgi:hypothetical protein
MRNERGEFPDVGRLLSQELLPAIRDAALEPIKFSQALKEKMTNTSLVPNYQDLGRVDRALFQVRGYMWGYLPVEMPLAMASGLIIMQGNIAGGLLMGAGAWMVEGALLNGIRIREQS